MVQRKRRSKLRFALFIVAALFAILFGVAAAKGWQVIDAIRTSENTSVVALPPRNPTIEAQLAQTQARLSQGKSVATPAASPVAGSATPVASAATPAAGGASPVANNATPISEGVASTVIASFSPTPALSESSGDQSNFGIVKDLISAGVNGGDPLTSSVWNGRTDTNILIAGVDRRPQGGDQNSDVIILVHVDLINKRVSAISIPRDLWVDIPGMSSAIRRATDATARSTPRTPAAGDRAARFRWSRTRRRPARSASGRLPGASGSLCSSA